MTPSAVKALHGPSLLSPALLHSPPRNLSACIDCPPHNEFDALIGHRLQRCCRHATISHQRLNHLPRIAAGKHLAAPTTTPCAARCAMAREFPLPPPD